MKIAILGGSFNPLHNGHIYIAEQVQTFLGYDKIIFVPAHISPFKVHEKIASNKDRMTMLKKALFKQSHFAIEDYEMKKKGLSYTYNTILYLEKKYSKQLAEEKEEKYQKLGLILGFDLIEDFHKWHEYKKLSEKVHFILARRSFESQYEREVLEKKTLESFPFPYELLENEYFDLSSSDIKEKIQKGESWQEFLPEAVATYIAKKELYAKH